MENLRGQIFGFEEIKEVLNQVYELRDEVSLSDWEKNFINSCWDWAKKGAVPSLLTKRQVSVLISIYHRTKGLK